VSIDLSRVTAAEPEAAAKAPDAAAAQRQRDQLQRIAQEFESMLLRQVLRDMRRAGAWFRPKAKKDSPGRREYLPLLRLHRQFGQ
jgi:Rod binding domain-containing protein